MNQLTNQIIIAVVLVVAIGLAVIYIPPMLKPKVIIKHERDIVPVPYYVREHRHNRRPYPRPHPSPYPRPHPSPHPRPHRPHGDRSTPFCEHTKYGCYPGTQTPIA